MNYYNASGQMDLSDRIAIETGICTEESFKKIAKRLRRHPSTIAHEVKENRTFIKGNYPNGKDCGKVRHCTVKNLCGCDEEACNTKCRLCRGVDCTKVCDRYVSVACHKFDSPPYVCNNCKDKKLCNKDKYIYSAKFADAAVTRRRLESRQGVRLSDEKKKELDELVTRLVKKGQPLTHIYAEHENEMPVCLKTLYNYIDEGALSIKNIDLRRKTGYKPREKKYNDINGFHSMEFRQGRMYEDFEYAMKFKYSEDEVTEMDTVKGVRESGKRLLTMIFRKNNVMLLFLMPDGRAESVKRYSIRVNEPPRTIKMKKIHYEYSLEAKPMVDSITFGLDDMDMKNYAATKYTKEGIANSSSVIETSAEEIVDRRKYSELSLVADIARYFPTIRCSKIAQMLSESSEGMAKILEKVNKQEELVTDVIVPTLFSSLYAVNKAVVKEDVAVSLLRKPKDGGYYEFNGVEDMVISENSEDTIVRDNKGKSFHADTYVFDSKPEREMFLQLLKDSKVVEAYFTGMFTSAQSDFSVPYIDPESHRLRKYYPDFLVKTNDGKYLILEVKGDNMLDDPVVKAKEAAAQEISSESKMEYRMIAGNDIMNGMAKI